MIQYTKQTRACKTKFIFSSHGFIYHSFLVYEHCSSLYPSIITQLEKLKQEAADVQKKVEETDVVMAEVETVSQQYLPLSTACSSIYFTLESLNQVRRL